MIKSKMLWQSTLGCLAALLALVLFSRSSGGAASWLLLLVPAVCLLGHSLPGLLGSKRSCHGGRDEEKTPARGTDEVPK